MLSNIKGGHVLVIGSQYPWIEVLLLEKGAHHVTTLEYAAIENQHPNITVITPNVFRNMYINGTFRGDKMFDAMVTYSSLEHSGLGRYGDPINPWGDLITMAKTLCVSKNGAMALVGIPSYFHKSPEKEFIGWNAGKLYGMIQLSHLFANWKQVHTDAIEHFKDKKQENKTIVGFEAYEYQPIYILMKP